uniref:EGF-like module receptor 1 n=1 Tax=Cebus imitator TaxID=2715852 RepID=A0A2K5S2W9_CEBIM
MRGFKLLLFWGCCVMDIWEMHTGPTLKSTIKNANKCRETTMCPAYATCTSNMDSYYCTCKRGFLSSNGQRRFKGPGVECKDIDECSQSPQPCGPNSVCKILLGRYSCACLHGFSSPTANGWISGKPGNFSCTDVDECLNPRACPEHATCHNTVGAYTCLCNPGFESSSGLLSFQGLRELCEDIDECIEMCPINSTCTNTPGSYFCTCHPGFAPSNGQLNFTDQEVECRDIDECLQDPSTCGPNSVCTNVLGSYNCGCIAGFRPNSEGSQKDGNFSCQRLPFKCKEDMIPNNEQAQQCQEGTTMKPEYVSFCALINDMFDILDNVCENKRTAVSMKIESKVIDKECSEENVTLSLAAKRDKMKIGCSTIEASESRGTTGVAFVSFVGVESVLDKRFFHNPQTPLANSEVKLKMNSRVVGGIMTGEKKDGFSDPVIYTLENIQPKQKFERPICVSWRTDVEGGRWTPSGCVVLEASEVHTICSCNHLANLAIIMASGELTMEFSLYIISHMGIIISLVCLILAIATFLLCRSIQNHNTYLHLHLCVCLLLAETVFLAGIDKTDNQMGCAIIAGFLHYFFLACFFWMLVEAVMLFLMVRNLKVVNYFSSRNIKMPYLCVFGYGLPGLVVVISASVQPQGYGMYNRCWLNTEAGFIWSFLGPVCIVIMINSILLTWTLWILRQRLSSVNAEVSTLKDTRLLTFKAFAQLFILGCSWVLGLFQFGPVAGVMAYLFTIINSLQGAFIFLIHCLLNHQVREEYKRWIPGKTKPSSESQTSRISLSSMPSTSKTG